MTNSQLEIHDEMLERIQASGSLSRLLISNKEEKSTRSDSTCESDASFCDSPLVLKEEMAAQAQAIVSIPEYEHFSFFQNVIFLRAPESTDMVEETLA